jgi:predicted anti-sigma-YlaC factor YlaD
MKCNAYEQSIYLWEEISPEEKVTVNRHMETCPDCAALFQQVQVMQQQVTKVSAKRTISPNAAQLTSRIMQAVHEQQQRSHTTRLTSVFSPFQLVRYACATLSLVLLISFGLEYVQTGAIQKTQTTTLEEGIILSSAIIRSSAADRKKRKSIFSACKTPFTDQLAYKECIKQQFQ